MIKKIVLLLAMEEELNPLLAVLEINHRTSIAGFSILQSVYQSLSITIVISGIGKVNAAIATTLAYTQFKPNLIINLGSSAGVGNQSKLGDIVVATELSYHDVDMTVFAYAKGQVPRLPISYSPCQKTLQAIQNFSDIIFGLVLIGDYFLHDPVKINQIKADFPTVQAIDMESTAIAQACYHFQQPFVVVRFITDNGDEQAKQMHLTQLHVTQQKTSQFLQQLFEVISKGI